MWSSYSWFEWPRKTVEQVKEENGMVGTKTKLKLWNLPFFLIFRYISANLCGTYALCQCTVLGRERDGCLIFDFWFLCCPSQSQTCITNNFTDWREREHASITRQRLYPPQWRPPSVIPAGISLFVCCDINRILCFADDCMVTKSDYTH